MSRGLSPTTIPNNKAQVFNLTLREERAKRLQRKA